jgi:integrase
MSVKLPPNVYRYRGDGFRAVAKVGHAKEDREETTFPAGTSMRVINTWLETTRTRLRERDKPKAGSMLDELPRYLAMKEGREMKSIDRREIDLRRMIALLGPHRTRAEIDAVQIEQMIVKLKKGGAQGGARTGKNGTRKAGGITAKVLDGATLNRNLFALQNFWTVMGGKSAANPVKDVQRFPELKRKKAPKITHELFDRILAVMGDHGGPAVKGQRRSETNLTRLRLKVIAFAGFPQQVIREIEPAEDIDHEAGRVFVGRNKGRGLPGKWRRMGAFAMDAIRECAEAGGFGPFSSSSMYKSFCLARDKAEPGSVVTPYKLRHLFANVGLRASGDPDASSRILLHGVKATSAIYREEAEDEQDGAAWAAIDAWHRKQGHKLTFPGKGLDRRVGRGGLRAVK